MAGGVVIWISQHYETIVKERLPGWVASTTDSTYTISVDEISINIFTRTITISQVSLKPDMDRIAQLRERHQAGNSIYDISIEEIKARGIIWEELIGNTEFTCGTLTIYRPDIVITTLPADTLFHKEKKEPKIERFAVNTIRTVDANIEYRNAKTADTVAIFLKKGDIELSNWEFKPGAEPDSLRFLLADEGTISFDTFYYKKKGGLYTFNTGKIEFSSALQNLKIHNLKLNPTVDKQQYYRAVGHQKEIFKGTFPLIELAGLDWRKAMTDSVLVAEAINISNANLSIYMDRRQPPNTQSKLGKFPHQLLQKMKLPVYVPKMNIKSGHFQYTEVSSETNRPGTLDFSNINGVITNVTNVPAQLEQNNHCLLKLRGKFMKKSDMVANFNLVLNDPNGAFSVTGYLKDLDEWQVRNEALALAMAEIKSLHLDRMDMNIQGNEVAAKGQFTIRYNDLKLQLQKVKEDGEMKKQGFLSFVANNILIYKDNPMQGEPVRTQAAQVERDIHKSFFNLIWATIFDAAKKTAARNDDVVNMLGKKKDKKAVKKDDDDKKGLFERIMDGPNKEKKEKRQQRRKERAEKRKNAGEN